MGKKLLLAHDCYCSVPCVHPKNWKTKSANTKITWYLSYRFYDPLVKNEHDDIKPKQVLLKGNVNDYVDLVAKQSAMDALYENEIDLLLKREYNPITGTVLPAPEVEPILNDFEIHPHTKLAEALWLACNKLDLVDHTREDMKSVITYFIKSCEMLRYDQLSISQIERRHIRYALDNCANLIVEKKLKTGEIKKRKKIWSSNQFNHYKAYLRMLFIELLELQAVKYNPVSDIRKKRVEKKIRDTLSLEERKNIDLHLRKKKMMTFRLFNRIFFHSGIRITEMLTLKGKDINLKLQTIKVTIKKGKEIIEKTKTIKDIALRYWKLALKNCSLNEHIFSVGLKPGNRKIRSEQITRRWETHVKHNLGITADYYSMKHANTTEMMDEQNVSAEDAASLNSHSSTAMVVNIYDVKANNRKHEKLKKVTNRFV